MPDLYAILPKAVDSLSLPFSLGANWIKRFNKILFPFSVCEVVMFVRKWKTSRSIILNNVSLKLSNDNTLWHMYYSTSRGTKWDNALSLAIEHPLFLWQPLVANANPAAGLARLTWIIVLCLWLKHCVYYEIWLKSTLQLSDLKCFIIHTDCSYCFLCSLPAGSSALTWTGFSGFLV